MKIKSILTVFAIAIATLSFSQTKEAMPSDEVLKQEATQLTEDMTSYLNLTDAQVKRMESLNYTAVQKRAELKSMGLTDQEMNEKINAFEERQKSTVKQVLDDAQFEKFEAKYSSTKGTKKEKSKM